MRTMAKMLVRTPMYPGRPMTLVVRVEDVKKNLRTVQ